MSISLDELEEKGIEVRLASDLPDRIVGTVENIQLKSKVVMGKEREYLAVSVRITSPEELKGTLTVIGYPKSTWKALAKQLKSWGFKNLEDIIGYRFVFERKPVGRVRYPRHFPVDIQAKPKK